MAKTIVQEFTKGLWDEIPPFRLVLGLCPVLAVTKTVANGVGMGVAATFVLVCSNILVSALRNIIPSQVRVPCFIIIIATFVVVVELVMQAVAYPLFLQLGIFIRRGLCLQEPPCSIHSRRSWYWSGIHDCPGCFGRNS